jgi:hypothetical protein
MRIISEYFNSKLFFELNDLFWKEIFLNWNHIKSILFNKKIYILVLIRKWAPWSPTNCGSIMINSIRGSPAILKTIGRCQIWPTTCSCVLSTTTIRIRIIKIMKVNHWHFMNSLLIRYFRNLWGVKLFVTQKLNNRSTKIKYLLFASFQKNSWKSIDRTTINWTSHKKLTCASSTNSQSIRPLPEENFKFTRKKSWCSPFVSEIKFLYGQAVRKSSIILKVTIREFGGLHYHKNQFMRKICSLFFFRQMTFSFKKV